MYICEAGELLHFYWYGLVWIRYINTMDLPFALLHVGSITSKGYRGIRYKSSVKH